jgi:O-antigen/teichoic acid export membrane protein
VGSKIAHGVGWMMLFRGAERLLGLVSTLLLVRLLSPGDFGVVAMATSIIAAVEVLGAFSFDTALIQRQDATRAHYDTAWTFNVIVGGAIAAALALLAVPAADFFNEPRLTVVVLLLALGSLATGFENIGLVDLRKKLQFDKEFKVLLAKKLVGFCLVVPLAIWLRSYWALVISIVAGKLAAVVISYVAHPFRPRFSLAQRNDLVSYSKWLFFNNLIVLARDRSADLAIGRFVGSHGLGIYTVSQEVSTLPQQFVAPVNRAVFPGYASVAASAIAMQQSFLGVTSLMWALAVPAGIGIALVAPVLVPVVLGENWLAAIPVIAILALSATLMVMESNVAYVFYALGAPRVTTVMMLGYVAVLLPLLLTFARSDGAVGAAWAHLLTSIFFVPISFGVVLRYLRLRIRAFLAATWRIGAAAGIMAFAVDRFVDWSSADGWPAAVSLVTAVTAGAAIYVGVMLALWVVAGKPAGVERTVLDSGATRLRALRRGGEAARLARPGER